MPAYAILRQWYLPLWLIGPTLLLSVSSPRSFPCNSIRFCYAVTFNALLNALLQWALWPFAQWYIVVQVWI
ncbi:hypothetical protein BDV98DRAFT_204890 [Pterulicium gracile]|uniref:Uncharacterized protein n=1 Tax=Pterulicium gracile TaxID=1884261 RepID=A0A5C3QDG3_9AGAR|nr:hypothetical protein BDV98DRAFT_204890 [Pterula gracilis]